MGTNKLARSKFYNNQQQLIDFYIISYIIYEENVDTFFRIFALFVCNNFYYRTISIKQVKKFIIEAKYNLSNEKYNAV